MAQIRHHCGPLLQHLFSHNFCCTRSQVFHSCIPYKTLEIELGIHPKQAPFPTSQIAYDVFDETEMIYQDVRKKAMQAYIIYKAHYDKKADISKLKEAEYV